MNNHLNIFRTYAKENRRYQLENDLTRAFAISMQENTLFFNEVLKAILDAKYSNELFNDLHSSNEISINIQKNSSEIVGFEKIFAVSLSEHVMEETHFWNQKHESVYDPICDIVIRINGVVIIIEAKRDNVDCTAQLYNQVFNVCTKNELKIEESKDMVTPRDLSWPKLMEIAVKVHSFERAAGSPSRFLNDFIDLVKNHNFRWLPEPSIFSVSPENRNMIERRIDSALNETVKQYGRRKLEYNDRLGLVFDMPWAEELLFGISENGDLSCSIYPGNTKAQGGHIFQNMSQPKSTITVNGRNYEVSINYHVKFTSWKRFFTGLYFDESNLKENLYTKDNFYQYCGRNWRGDNWSAIEALFDRSFQESYNWRAECGWDSKVLESNRSQFDMSFGYELGIAIPFQVLREVDQDKADLSGLTALIENIYTEFRAIYS